jgi:hypothetical protein
MQDFVIVWSYDAASSMVLCIHMLFQSIFATIFLTEILLKLALNAFLPCLFSSITEKYKKIKIMEWITFIGQMELVE